MMQHFFVAGLAFHLDERAQIVIQALLVTFGDYVYDHPESKTAKTCSCIGKNKQPYKTAAS